MSAEAAIEKLLAIHPKGFDLSLGRISKLLDKLGNPHRSIPPVFHIAGTNGKGSTAAFLRAIIEAGGKTTHVHTSPHLVNWHERYRLGHRSGGKLVSDKKLEAAITKAVNANAGKPVTVFEIMSAVAFLLFSENKADFSIIEVGLGGRFDATNVIEHPLVSIITPIGLDHQSFLGETLEKITFEKAGIIKSGTAVIIGPQADNVRQVLERIAVERGCKSYIFRQDYDGYEQRGRFVYQDEFGLLDLPLPNLRGAHQLSNAATAIAATRVVGQGFANEVYETAMSRVDWPGRLERLKPGKLLRQFAKSARDNLDIWVDGGHNPQAGEMLSYELSKMQEQDCMPLVMICGMLTTKDPSGFFDHFTGKVDRLITVPVTQSDSAFSPEELAKFATQSKLNSQSAAGIESALGIVANEFTQKAAGAPGAPVRVIICGSLYLVGEVLGKNGTPPK